MNDFKWTSDKPTETGWYWYRPKNTDAPYPVKVYTIGDLRYVWPLGTIRPISERLERCPGEWAGPLEPPA